MGASRVGHHVHVLQVLGPAHRLLLKKQLERQQNTKPMHHHVILLLLLQQNQGRQQQQFQRHKQQQQQQQQQQRRRVVWMRHLLLTAVPSVGTAPGSCFPLAALQKPHWLCSTPQDWPLNRQVTVRNHMHMRSVQCIKNEEKAPELYMTRVSLRGPAAGYPAVHCAAIGRHLSRAKDTASQVHK